MKRFYSINCLALCLLLLVTALTGCGKAAQAVSSTADPSWQKVSEKKSLIVGVYADNFPMTYSVGKSYAGYDIDMMTEIAKRLGLEVQFVSVDTQGAWNALSLAQVDCICSGFALSSAKEELYQLSEVYLSSRQVFVLRDDSTVKDIADMAGCVLGVNANGNAKEVLNDATVFCASLGGVVDYASDFDTLNALINGEIDVAAVSQNSAAYYKQMGNSLHNLSDVYGNEEVISSEDYVIAVKRGSASLMSKLEETIATMKRDGLLEQYVTKWFNETQDASSQEPSGGEEAVSSAATETAA